MEPGLEAWEQGWNQTLLAEWQGVIPIGADITRREDLEKLPGPFDWVINTVSSTKGGVEEYRAVYLEGTRHLLDWLARHPPRRKKQR